MGRTWTAAEERALLEYWAAHLDDYDGATKKRTFYEQAAAQPALCDKEEKHVRTKFQDIERRYHKLRPILLRTLTNEDDPEARARRQWLEKTFPLCYDVHKILSSRPEGRRVPRIPPDALRVIINVPNAKTQSEAGTSDSGLSASNPSKSHSGTHRRSTKSVRANARSDRVNGSGDVAVNGSAASESAVPRRLPLLRPAPPRNPEPASDEVDSEAAAPSPASAESSTRDVERDARDSDAPRQPHAHHHHHQQQPRPGPAGTKRRREESGVPTAFEPSIAALCEMGKHYLELERYKFEMNLAFQREALHAQLECTMRRHADKMELKRAKLELLREANNASKGGDNE